MGKPIIEAVYLRDIQRQSMDWMHEKWTGWNATLTGLHQQSLSALQQTVQQDADRSAQITKLDGQIPIGATTDQPRTIST